MRPLRWAAVAVASSALASCTGGGGTSFPSPPSTELSTTTTLPDYSTVPLDAVPGRTTTTVDNGPGKAHLTGSVIGPEGPVPGATVRIQRLVGDVVLSKDLTSGPDGGWRLDLIKGGRYRVRAFRPPDLAQIDPPLFYLGATETRDVPLNVLRYSGIQVTGSIAPSPPVLNDPANLVALVTSAVVDTQGIVRGTPQLSADVQLVSGIGWSVETPASQTTDSSGQVRWRITCRFVGASPLSVVVGSGTPTPLNVPSCEGSPPPPTTIGGRTNTPSGVP